MKIYVPLLLMCLFENRKINKSFAAIISLKYKNLMTFTNVSCTGPVWYENASPAYIIAISEADWRQTFSSKKKL